MFHASTRSPTQNFGLQANRHYYYYFTQLQATAAAPLSLARPSSPPSKFKRILFGAVRMTTDIPTKGSSPLPGANKIKSSA